MFVEDIDFLTCFDDFQIGHNRNAENYTDTWYDISGDYSFMTYLNFTVEVPESSGDLYFSLEYYYWEMVPKRCSLFMGNPMIYTKIYKNDEMFEYYYFDYYHEPMMFAEADYEAGDIFTIEYDTMWFFSPIPRDYTIKVYSSQDLEIKDSDGNTNMLHMDGQQPSGFESSWW